jgi:hypothetical protein
VRGLTTALAHATVSGWAAAASSEPVAAEIVREMIGGQLVELARVMEGARPDVRASLIATQVLGMVIARYVVQVEPLASMDADEIAEWLERRSRVRRRAADFA